MSIENFPAEYPGEPSSAAHERLAFPMPRPAQHSRHAAPEQPTDIPVYSEGVAAVGAVNDPEYPTIEQPTVVDGEPVIEEYDGPQLISNEDPGRNHKGNHRRENGNKKWRLPVIGATVLAIATGVSFQQGWIGGDKKPAGVEATQPTASPERSKQTPEKTGKDIAVVLPPELDKSGKEDLIKGGTWNYLPGVHVEGNVLQVSRTGLKLREQADDWTGEPSKYIADPAQNVYGTRLETGGKDFGIAVHVTGAKEPITDTNPAVFNFYSEPDERYDEGRHYEPKTQVSVGSRSMTVRVWQGNGPNADEKKTISWEQDVDGMGFTMQQNGNDIEVAAGGKKVAIEADMYRSSGQVVLGFDGGNFAVDEFAAYPAKDGGEVTLRNTAEVQLAPLDADGLQQMASAVRPDLKIGIATNMRPVTEYPAIAEAYGKNASVIQPEMDMKPQAIYTGKVNADGTLDPNAFHWEAADAFKKLAKDSGREYSAHTPLFGEANPQGIEIFLQETIDGRHGKEEFETLMDSWAKEYFGRFQDARAIDVLNEPLADTGVFDPEGEKYNNNLWARASKKVSGDQRFYMKKAFELGRKYANPNTKLYLNENGMESDKDRLTVAIDLAEYINRDGNNMDGMRFQAHIDSSDIKKLQGNATTDAQKVIAVRENMLHVFARTAKAGLQSEVSEYSVDSDDDREKELFSEGFMAAVLYSNNTSGIQFWSPTNGPDGFTTSIETPGDGYGLEYGNDGLFEFDEDSHTLTETAVMRGIKKALKN